MQETDKIPLLNVNEVKQEEEEKMEIVVVDENFPPSQPDEVYGFTGKT